jgi:protein involved in polysaccharide export with SLBB domain
MLPARAASRALGLILLVLVACVSVSRAADEADYKLGPGDKLRVTVFNEPDLSGEFDVGGQGTIALPLIGQVTVVGLTLSEVDALITQKYGANYLVAPRVSVEVLNYRPFFIIGEVNHPGSYPYVNGMTVLNAVALAGGYTPRADKSDILLRRANSGSVPDRPVKEDTVVLPGDVINVQERFF